MAFGHARETVSPSSVEREPGPSRQASKGASIALIDRRALTRQCLSQCLQGGSPDLRVVAVGDPADLLDASRSLRDLQLMVFNIGGASVRDAQVLGQIAWLRQRMPNIPLVLLSDHDDVEDIVEAMGHGVRGFIPTSMELLETAAVIQCVAAGGTYVPASILTRFAQNQQYRPGCGLREDGKGLLESLTPREREVLARLSEGKPNKVIAHELNIREGTVKVFVRRILSKLHASNRTELALLARVWSTGAEPTGSDQH